MKRSRYYINTSGIKLNISYNCTGEVDGIHYNFVSRETIEEMIRDPTQGNFLEYAEVHKNLYGTSSQAVQSVHRLGKVIICNVSVFQDFAFSIDKFSNVYLYYKFLSFFTSLDFNKAILLVFRSVFLMWMLRESRR